MTYNPINFNNGKAGGTPVSASNLRHVENGIVTAHNDIAALTANVNSLSERYGTPLVAHTAAEMTDNTKIYVYVGSETGYTTGDWYYYDGDSWESGGAYNSTAVNTDKTLTQTDMAADSKKVGDEISDLKSALNGGIVDIPYVITGSGYIYDYSASLITLNYTPDGTALHKIMAINDLSAYGLAVGDELEIKVGFNDAIKYAVGFGTGAIGSGSTTMFSAVEFPSEDSVQTIRFTIPNGTACMAIYNRSNVLANPTIKLFTDTGLTTKVEKNTSDIEDLQEASSQNTSDIEELQDIVSEVKYKTCVRKPFTFTNKKLWFFGDSITYGYIATPSAHQATNQYPKVFSEAVGADSYVNWGVSGSTLADNYITISTHPLNCDFVFVAGGVNDWQTGVNESTLITTMTNICEHLKNNFSGEVVFITPIYEAGRVPISTPTQTLQNVRNVITRIALEYGYSVVQGWEFPFPTEDDDTDYIDLMFQDKIHPTELGYSMYAQALRNALC